MKLDKNAILEAFRDDPDLLTGWVDQSIADIENGTRFRATEINRKNINNKICWLLYIFQKAKFATEATGPIDDNIFILKNLLKGD